jgi:hypothetical protein
MAGIQRGRNWGITGIVNLGDSPQFTVEVRAFKEVFDTARKNRAGRGQGAWRKSRATAPGGSLVLSGKVTLKGYPMPATWKGQRGTLVITYHRGAKETLDIEVEGVVFSSKQVAEDRWDVTISCSILANPTFAGFGGSQPAATTPAQSDVQIYEGLTKVQDPKGIQDGATTTYDVWPLGDSDSAENARIAAVIAATAPPFQYAKVKTASLLPNRDSEGGTVQITWSLTDTEEDVINQMESETNDPNLLTSQAQTAGISQLPDDPGGDFVERETTTSEVNDQKTITSKKWGLRDTVDDVQMPQSPKTDDPYDLKDAAHVCLVTGSSTAPPVPTAPIGQHVETTTTQINRKRWQHVFSFLNINSEQEIEFPAAIIQTDPSALQSSDVQSDVTDSSTPPAEPGSRVAGLVLRVIRSRRVSGTPEKWLHTWEYGQTSTEEDITYPGTVTDNEVSDIADVATITLINTSSTPPTTPAAPVGQLLSIESVRLTDAGKWKHVFKYGNTTALQRIQFPTDTIETDPNQLQDEDSQSQVAATSTVPAAPVTRVTGLVLRRVTSVRIAGTPEKWLHRWFFGRTTTVEDITFPGTVTSPDVSNLEDKATITLVTSSGTPAAAPAAPVGQHVGTRTEQLTDAGKWKHTYFYANNTSAQNVTFPDSPATDDPNDLRDEQRIALLTSSSTLPATPTPTVSGVKLRLIESKRIAGTPEKWEHTFFFARRHTVDDVQMDGSTYHIDPSELEDKVEITIVEADNDPDGGITVAGFVLRDTIKKQLHDNAWAITYVFARTTSQEDIEFAGSIPTFDPKTLVSEATITMVNSSSTYPVTLNSPPAGLKLRKVSSKQLTDAGKWQHAAEYGLRNTEDDVEMSETKYDTDPSALEDHAEITVVESDATPDGGVTVSGLVLRAYRKKQLHDTKWAITYIFGRTTTQEDVEYPGTVTNDDPSNILDHATVTLVTSSGTYPVALDTPPAGLKLRDIESVRLTDAGKWKHTGTYGRRNSEDDVEMGGTVYATDSSALEDTAEVTVVEADGTPDGGVTVSGLVLRFTRRKQIHDTKWEITYVFGKRTTEEDHTFPGTVNHDDPKNLLDRATVTLINTSSTYPVALDTPPAGLKLRDIESLQITDAGKWKHTAEYGRRNTEDDVEMAGTLYADDGSALEDTAEVTVVEADGTADGGVTVSGLVLRFTKRKQIHDTKWEITYVFGRRTTEQDITFPGTDKLFDPSNLINRATVTLVNSSSTYPAALDTPPAGLKLRDVKSEQVTNAGKWKHTGEYGLRDTKDDVEMEGSVRTDDPSALEDKVEVTVVENDDTPDGFATPAGFQPRGTTFKQLHDGKWAVTYHFARRTSAADIIYPGTVPVYDPSLLVTSATITDINSSSTYPVGFDTPPAGLKLRNVNSEQLTGAGKWKHKAEYGLRNTSDDVTMPDTVGKVDSSNIIDTYTVAVVTNTATHAAPGAASGYILRTSTLKQIHDSRWEHLYEYGRRTVEDDYEFDGSHVVADAEDLQDEVVISEVQSSATPNAAAASPPAGLLLRVIRSKQLTSTNTKWLHSYFYDRNTTKTALENAESNLTEDAAKIKVEAEVAQVYTTASGVPVAPAAADAAGDLETYSRTIKQLNNIKSIVTTEQRLFNPQTEIEFGGTKVEYDFFKNVSKTVTEILASDVDTDELEDLADAYRDTVKNDVTIDSFTYERINNLRVKRIINYVDQYNIFEGAGAPYRIPKQAFLLGGVVFVNVAEVVQRGTGLWEVLLAPLTVWGWRFDFTLRRRVAGSVIPLRYAYFNTVNSDTFLGFGATGVTFMGPRPRTNGNIVNPHVTEIGYDFSFDVNGWNDEAGIRMGWITTDFDPGLGLKPATSFGWAASRLPAVDYTPAFVP